MSKQLKLFKEEELPVWVNEVPFVSEVEEFNETFGKPNNYEPTIPEKKNGNLYMTSFKKSSKSIEKLAKTETLWKFWMLCATLLMFPLGTVLCYTALRIRYGQHIKRYKEVICQKLVKLKKRPYSPSAKEVRNKVRPVILKNLRRDGTLSTDPEIRKVMKSINYFRPDLSQFFKTEELAKFYKVETII